MVLKRDENNPEKFEYSGMFRYVPTTGISVMTTKKEPGVKPVLMVVVGIEGLPFPANIEIDSKEEADEFIAMLVDARKKLWPGK